MSRADISTPLRPGTPARRPVALGVIVVMAWTLILGVVVGVGWLITHPWAHAVDSFDNPVSRWFAGERTSALNAPAEVGTFLGETVVGMGVAVVAAVGFSLWRRQVRPAVFLALVTAGVGGFYFVATHVDPRQRPPVRILDPGLVPDHSFPSGHVGTATAVYGAIVVLAWAYAREQHDAVLAAMAEYSPDVPVVLDVDFGHTDPQLVLPHGGDVRIDPVARSISVRY